MRGDATPVRPVGTFSGVDALLHLARRELAVDIAAVSRFEGDVCRVRHVAVGSRVGTRADFPHPRRDCLCERVDPELVLPDATADAHVARLSQDWRVQIGSLAAIRLCHPDGRPWGVLTVSSREPRPGLDARALERLRAVADTLMDVLLVEEAVEPGGDIFDEVHEVVASGRLEIVLQPVVHLRSGCVVAHEALTRFPHSDKPTWAWFQDASHGGVGPVLERATVERALELLPRVSGRLSVNLSSETLLQRSFAGWAEGLPWHRVVVEITEQQPVEDYERLAVVLDDLRSRGALVAVDDTGSGYSSLRHAIAVSPDLVKLDLSLVQGVHADPAKQAVVAAVCSLATGMGARVIGEGIETREDLDCLVSLGVQLGQGYLLGRPAVVATGAAS